MPDTRETRTAGTLEQRVARLSPAKRALFELRSKGGPVSGHALVAGTLRDLGVTRVYGVPGQPTYDTFGACARHGIRPIGTRHQQAGALMAAAQNYLAGTQTAATIVSAGVPTANALTGAVVARDDCWPLVVLGGSIPRAATGTGYFMALDGVSLYAPVTKWAARVPSSAAIPEYVGKAFAVAASGRPGPVFLDLPEDVLTGLAPPSSIERYRPGTPERAEPDPASVQRAAAALAAARRPLLVIGKSARWSAPFAQLQRLVEGRGLPFISSPIARGALPDDHPLCMNAIPWLAQEQADLVLLLGARLGWAFRYGSHIGPAAAVIQVDIHEAEIGRNRPATVGVLADVGAFLHALLAELARPGAEAPGCGDPVWVAELEGLRRRKQEGREQQAADERTPVSPLRLARELRDALPDDAISIFDGNLTMAACQQMIPARRPASRLTAGTSGCMGVGIPYAIAAKLEHPERPVVAVCGDFAFGLSAMELETAVRHDVPIVVVVANNDGNSGSLRQNMHLGRDYAEPVMSYQAALRYDRIMDVFGGHCAHVERPGDIGDAVQRALAGGRAACINVRVDADAPFPFN